MNLFNSLYLSYAVEENSLNFILSFFSSQVNLFFFFFFTVIFSFMWWIKCLGGLDHHSKCEANSFGLQATSFKFEISIWSKFIEYIWQKLHWQFKIGIIFSYYTYICSFHLNSTTSIKNNWSTASMTESFLKEKKLIWYCR